jgi:hypothetical protein
MKYALLILLILAVFLVPSLASSDSYGVGTDAKTTACVAGDKCNSGGKIQENSYPYEKCSDPNCPEYGKTYHADGICPNDGEKCRMFEYCPKCGITYEIKDGKKADGTCDFCGSSCYMSEKCDKCGFAHYFDGYCDKCGEKCDYNRCVQDCYIKCSIYEYCLNCGEKHSCDGYCDKCGDSCNTYAYCPKCNEKYAADGTMNCPGCGERLVYVEQCDKCGYNHYYDGYCDSCHQKCFYDRCCYTYCDKYCYEYSDKCLGGLCPGCGETKTDIGGSNKETCKDSGTCSNWSMQPMGEKQTAEA